MRGDVEKPLRTIGRIAILGASFNILNTWFGLASTLVFGFSNGGPVTIIYGLFLISIIYTANAFSLAELSAKYPTAGGQYHWTSILAPPRFSRILVRLRTSIVSNLMIAELRVWGYQYCWQNHNLCQRCAYSG